MKHSQTCKSTCVLCDSVCACVRRCVHVLHCVLVLCVVYEQSEKMCKEYGRVKGAGTIARPERHPFFQGLGPLLQRHLEKAERENGFM